MTIKSLALAAVAATALTASAFAETALPENTFIAAETATQYLAKDRLIGTKVKGPDGKIVGDIEDVILSGDNRVVGVIMGTGGFFGLAEKKVGVEIGALSFEVSDTGTISATLPSATQEVIDAAPAFERSQPQKSLFQRAVEKGQEIRDKTGHSASEAYESAKEKAGPALEKAKETAKEVYDTAKEKAGEAVEKAKEAAKSEGSAPAETPAAPAETPAAPAETPAAPVETPAAPTEAPAPGTTP